MGNLGRAAIPWGLMLVLGLLLIWAGFTDNLGAILAALFAPSQLVDTTAGSPPPPGGA